MPWTTTDLISSIKRRTGMPAAQASYTAAELLTIATDELWSYVVPLVLAQHEDYWLKHTEEPLIDGVYTYPMPGRAIGAKLREVLLLDDRRNPTNVPRLDAADLTVPDFGFVVDGDAITLLSPQPIVSWGYTTLRLSYYLRPSQLVETSAAAVISDVDTAAGTVDLATVPAAFAGIDSWDLVGHTSPFSVRGIEQPGVLSGSTITFTGGVPPNVAVGDYVCLPGQSPCPQLPAELHGLLAQKVACRVLADKQMGDKLKMAEMELSRMEATARILITPRVDGESPKMVVRNGLHRCGW